MLKQGFFETDPVDCARQLIGCELRWGDCAGLIVETEAYSTSDDEACHTFLRTKAKGFVDANVAGTAYVYLNYGMHWMLNVLIKGPTASGFVLIRALEPVSGIEIMEIRRNGLAVSRSLCSGPGKLAQALGINQADHGRSLTIDKYHSFHARSRSEVEILEDLRVGISKAADLPWRFLLAGSQQVSVPFGKVKRHLTKTQRTARRNSL